MHFSLENYFNNDFFVVVVSLTVNINPVLSVIIAKQLRVEGFIVHRWFNQWPEAIEQLSKWILSGKLKYRETISNGFESLPTAFIGMLRGENTGKALVKK